MYFAYRSLACSRCLYNRIERNEQCFTCSSTSRLINCFIIFLSFIHSLIYLLFSYSFGSGVFVHGSISTRANRLCVFSSYSILRLTRIRCKKQISFARKKGNGNDRSGSASLIRLWPFEKLNRAQPAESHTNTHTHREVTKLDFIINYLIQYL